MTYAYFSAGQALTFGSNSISTSNVFASINSGAAGACTQVIAAPSGNQSNGCPMIYSVASGIGSSAPTGTNSSTVLLSMAGLGNLAPGTYNGTLNLVAVVQ